MQFAQYGMTSIPEEYIDNYANELLKKREAVPRSTPHSGRRS